MAGFRGVPPSQETVRQLLTNLQRSREGFAAKIAAGACPHTPGPKGEAPIAELVGINAALTEVFTGLLN